MDGIEMARLLQTQTQLDPFPDIILLSSDDINLQRNKLAEYGIKRYLIKPVFQDNLIKLLNEVAENVDFSQPEVKVYKQKDISPVKKKHKVLLAEDNLINQKLAFGLLENLGCKVTIVNNGKEALAASSENQYDIIFMDVQMPEMDGLEATALIREHEKQTGIHTPIVAMTAHAMKGDREKCLDAGMDEYTTKPISLKSITETIKRLNISPE
jgi:CheY-like chemotaxis protein